MTRTLGRRVAQRKAVAEHRASGSDDPAPYNRQMTMKRVNRAREGHRTPLGIVALYFGHADRMDRDRTTGSK